MAATGIWYFARNGERVGPVSEFDLIGKVARGEVRADDLVWKEGMPQWAAAGSLAELFAQNPSAPMVVPHAPPAQAPQPHVGHIPYAGGTMPGPGAGALDYFTQPRVTYAGFWVRVVAHFIDSLILGLPFCLIQAALQAALGAPATVAPPGPGATVSLFTPPWLVLNCGLPIVQIVVFWLYFALQESSTYQATLGKRVMGLYVTDTFGRPISFGRASARYFASFLSSLILGIGYIMAAFTERKQTLHDMMADTLVMKR